MISFKYSRQDFTRISLPVGPLVMSGEQNHRIISCGLLTMAKTELLLKHASEE